jgi:hypothetical protein
MHELEVGARAQLLGGPAERALDRRVGVLDESVEPRGDEEVYGEVEEARRDALDADGRLSARVDFFRPPPWVQSTRGRDVVRYA